MKKPSIHPKALASSLRTNRTILWALAKRDFAARYRGASIGILWAVFQPLLLLSVYTFAFGVALKPSMMGRSSPADLAISIFANLLLFTFFAESISRSASLLYSHQTYVKRVIFPLEILPIIPVISALFQLAIGFVVWVTFYFYFRGLPFANAVAFPALLIPLILMTTGVCWILSAAGAYIKDVTHLVGLFVTILMFVSPVFFSTTDLPPSISRLVMLNPLAQILELNRGLLVHGQLPPPAQLIQITFTSVVTACAGFALFQSTRRGFADVL